MKLADEPCASLVQELIARDVDARLKSAVDLIKTRGASIDYSPAVRAVDELLELSASYQAAAAAAAIAVAAATTKQAAALAAAKQAGVEKTVVIEEVDCAILPGVAAFTTAGTSFATDGKPDLLVRLKFTRMH